MYDELVKLLANVRRCAVLTGAGISAESGVPTFRGQEGLWGKFKPEELASMSAFMASPKIVWEWYNWRRELIGKVTPNTGHRMLAEMETMFEKFVLITQNVDNLHAAAGSKSILELHGNIYRNKCLDCDALFEYESDINPTNIPTCRMCGGKIRPDVVWFGEMLDPEIINTAFAQSEKADVFFSIGTSALVHPAATLPVVAKNHGATLVEINVEETPLTNLADFHFSGKSGEILPELMARLKERRSMAGASERL
ncbi:MAG TPA: NAD-dependent deacylase [candidate division Zixibacteria bacterium]|nr:NAD-dependent deacylase [candidate division Zixibacteria bacterium]